MQTVWIRVQPFDFALASFRPVKANEKVKIPIVNKWTLRGHLINDKMMTVKKENEMDQK